MKKEEVDGSLMSVKHEDNDVPKIGWTVEELARSLSVSVPFLRLEIKRGRLRAAHLGRRVVLFDRDVRRYLAEADEQIR